MGELADQVLANELEHVVITGGEPMLMAELIPLSARLKKAGRHVTIETAGTLYLPVECDLISISPKFDSSAPSRQEHAKWHERHQRTRDALQVVQRLIREYPYQIKFVIDSTADCEEAERYLDRMPEIDRDRAMLMPQGVCVERLEETARWLKPYCDRSGLRYCPRWQIEWFGLQRGT